MKILAIDDEAIIRELVQELLVGEGYEVITGENAEIGIEKAKTEKPDLIITDMSMPGMTGFEFIKRLKTDTDTKHIPIIALTATARTQDDRTEAYEGGVEAYEAKPISGQRLIEKIRKILS